MSIDIKQLFENETSISPGSLGGKIKRLRELRGLTQKELGLRSGFSATSADVRIAQYEKNKKIPREKVLKDICHALSVDECSLFDADLFPFNRMFHALFDIEDFHTLHPVKIDGCYYLEFGGCNIMGNNIHQHDFDDFMEKWYEMYQKHLPSLTDSDEAKNKKASEYTLWRYEFPRSISEEVSEKQKMHIKMTQLQAELDTLNANMYSDSEFSKINSIIENDFKRAQANYVPITKESDFILLIFNMLKENIYVTRFSPDATDITNYDYSHIVSFKTKDIVNTPEARSYYAQFLCQIQSMQEYGIDINSSITSKNKELYITYKVPSSQYGFFENLAGCWNGMTFIIERKDSWSKEEIETLEMEFIKKITGSNDVLLKKM